MKRLVIGFGNSLRGDDGFGPLAAQKLAALVPDAHTVTCHQLLPELAEDVAKCDFVLFFDASAGDPAGEIRTTVLEPVAPAADAMDHRLDPRALLGLAERLYGQSPRAALVTVGGACFDLSEGLSEPVATALPRAVDLAFRLMA